MNVAYRDLEKLVGRSFNMIDRIIDIYMLVDGDPQPIFFIKDRGVCHIRTITAIELITLIRVVNEPLYKYLNIK
jgi:hypothetical protein